MQEDRYDYLFKILIIGESCVGKTSLMLRYTEDSFTDTFISTIGVDFKIKTTKIDDKIIKLQIWDTAGQERFKTIISSYYRGAHGVIICYDTTNRESFECVSAWIDEIQRYSSTGIAKILVGTKNDLKTKRQVSYIEGRKLAVLYGMDFIETSAKESNLGEVFENLSRFLTKKRVHIPLAKSIVIGSAIEEESMFDFIKNCW
jgi:Ras-related protein Rab-1A